MKKHFFSALLFGAVFFSAETLISCDNDDIDDLKSRVSVIEIAIDDIKTQLSKALMTGASITNVVEKEGTYTLTLSDGQTIILKPGGGADISVIVTDTEAIIKIDGEEYRLPLGSKVNSLIYVPEYEDGLVKLGNTPVEVKFLARPAINNLDGAEFTIAEAHELKTRGVDGEEFGVRGEIRIEGEYIVVPIKGIGCEAEQTYAVSVQLNIGGTVIGSNYFNIEVSSDFFFNAEEIGGFKIKDEYKPSEVNENGFCQMTVNGVDLLSTITNFKDFFEELPENAIFRVAATAKQPEGDAQEKRELLSRSLKPDGTWQFVERPGTNFNKEEGQSGFLINIVVDDVIKAKIYVCIDDELADLDFANVFTEEVECEWGGREKSLPMGTQEIDIQRTFTNWSEDYTIIHRGQSFLENWANGAYQVQTADGDNVLIGDGSTILMDEIAKKYAAFSRGIYWYFRGISLIVPEAFGEWTSSEGKVVKGGEEIMGTFNDAHKEDPENYEKDFEKYAGVKMDQKTGKIFLDERYTGWGFRFAIAATYEYAYGTKKLHTADQFGFFFFNRRMMPEGTVILE